MDKTRDSNTFFDSPERSSFEEILNESKFFRSFGIIQEILDGFPELVVILNKNRQIIAFNSKAQKLLVNSKETILGQRFGEAIGCIYHQEMDAGCGTSQMCKECGAARSIKSTKETKEEEFEECTILTDINGNQLTLDLKVHTKILKLQDFEYIMFSIKDIADERKRITLEKIFFHDILNTGGAINGLAHLLLDENTEEEMNQLVSSLVEASNQLIGEINNQKDLRDAEDGNLEVDLKPVSVNKILKTAYDIYRNHDFVTNNHLFVSYLKKDASLITDPVLLVRSISNLLKNAIEASTGGGYVKVYSEIIENRVEFYIFNSNEIPQKIKPLIFRRSFSTKSGKNRGLGTYSVKLLIERYLGGEVNFISDPENKTIFRISLPLKPE